MVELVSFCFLVLVWFGVVVSLAKPLVVVVRF